MVRRAAVAMLITTVFCGCGDDAPANEASTTGSSGPSSTGSGGASAGGASATSTTSTSGQGGQGGEGGASPSVPDPAEPGPFTVETLAPFSVTIDATGSTFQVIGAAPTTGPEAGPYPVVVIGHGFQLPTSQYASYAAHAASFGYVALIPNFPATTTANHVRNAADLIGTVDAALETGPVQDRIDPTRIATSGHSLGGKAALLAALEDDRVQAVVALDPVDARPPLCSATDCPYVAPRMAQLDRPTALLGETLDLLPRFGIGPACAPEGENFRAFYDAAQSPSLEVEIEGAAHMSFLDDRGSCGTTCNVCFEPTVDDSVVGGLSRAYLVAFLERHVRGLAGYDAYLTGGEAQARYVTTGIAELRSK